MKPELAMVHVTYEWEDGSESQAVFYADAGWQQFGASSERLGRTVYLTEGIAEAVSVSGMLEEEE